LVDGTLYASTPLGSVIALDPATGAERWQYEGTVGVGDDYGDFANRDRSAAAWMRGRAGQPCALRIFVATVGARLAVLDARTGRPCDDFAAHGAIDLTVGLRHQPE